ncbi:trifunctional serine/threonine-protein kinase/ATP-binding protein/sensor histidine kinase [Paraburkholderia pallida]|nr:ATP-binding sensor histidine kinase [Paraburkholderia pallida]
MTIANYQIIERICETADSGLFRAHRLTDGVPVLLRLPLERTDVGRSARFQHEYLLLRSLTVAGIAKPLALVNEGGHLALVLENFAGESLETMLGRVPRINVPLCLQICRSLADALVGTTTAQIIHRDIRPSNILVDPNTGRVLLVDLSLATTQEHNANSPEESSISVGDWAYVAPEQTGRMNRTVDYGADFYSTGVLLYRMLTGQLPFWANDPLEWTHCHIARMPTPPNEVVPDVPQSVSDIVMKLLAKLPEERYQSAYGLRADLDRCLEQQRTSGCIQPFPLGTDDISERVQIPHILYGRGPEVERLLGAFDHMVETGQASLATVSGYSGVGKSSVVDALRKPIVEKHSYFITGKFDQYQRDVPYAILTQAFGELLRQLLAESEVRIAGWRQRIQGAVGVNGRLIVDVLPQVELIIGPQPPVSPLPPAEAQNRFQMVFRQFVTAFTSEERPLVVFLDDLQWIDAASLTLVEHLLTHPDVRYLLLIGAYRDNEVSDSHPLMDSLRAIRNSGSPVTDLRLVPLSLPHLTQLVADTLHATAYFCEPLARLIRERTEGNPFFFIQFLHALHREGLLWQDMQHRSWHWDLSQIKAMDFADNVVDLMVGKLRRLPTPAQKVLQLAACLGNTFDLHHLTLATSPLEDQAWQRMSETEVEQGLAAAVRENLTVRTGDTGKFLHDRIQQAAYFLIPEVERPEVHLYLGRALLASMTTHELGEHVFDVANQFNRGAARLVDRDEKAEVAAINLRAGGRAKTSAAYASARLYFAAGMALLDETYWAGHYELMFKLRLECAECDFLTGELGCAEDLLAELLQRGKSKVDVAAVYDLQVLLHIVQSENTQAVDSALECLKLFGIDIPAHPTWEQVQAEYETFSRNLEGRTIEDLIDLPLMEDPELQAATRLLCTLSNSAYVTDRNLFCLELCRTLNLSISHGVNGASAHACGYFGFTLGPAFQRYPEGFRLAKLGCDLVEKHDFLAYRAKVQDATAIAAFWTHPLETSIDFIRATLRTATGTGDLTYACYGMLHIIMLLLMRNDPLDSVWRESEIARDFVHKSKFGDIEEIIIPQQRFIAAMQGRTVAVDSFSDAEFDEAEFESQVLERGLMPTKICWYWIAKAKARFVASDYTEALVAADHANALLWSSTAHFPLFDYYFYTALILASLYNKVSAAARDGWRDRLAVHEEQLREWAEQCPSSFADKHALVSAEVARVDGRNTDAMRLYDEAIRLARENGFVQNEGTAHELAAEFYRVCEATTAARAHLEEARSCFARWGAHAKVAQLDARMSPLSKDTTACSTTLPGNLAQLDLLSVTKASQAISSPIILEDLVDTLMRIVLESAGAQSGQLLLARNETLVLAAEASSDQEAIHVRRRLQQAVPAASPPGPAMTAPEVPSSIVHYVRRSQERVLLDDATQLNPYSADEYLVRRSPKSVLCLPLMRRTDLIGMLYLENNLATHAFTPERVTVLELLASQAAITLENAFLYRDIAEREAKIRRLVDANIVGIFIWDLEGQILEANDAFLRIVGYDREDFVSGDMRWTTLTPPEWLERDIQERVPELKVTGTLKPFEKVFCRKDGSRVPVLLGAAMFEDSANQGVAFVLDLTEAKRAEAELAEQRAAAKQAEDQLQALQAELARVARVTTLGELSASIAHEVGQPLCAIVTCGEACLQWLSHSTPQLERVRACVEHMIVDGERASEIVRRIRALTKGAAPQKTRVEINDVVNDVASLVQREILSQRVALLLQLAPQLPPVLGDRVQLQQVLINLVINGIQAMADIGDGPRELRIESRIGEAGQVVISIEDSGTGIDPENTNRLFDTFFTTKPDGMGMGLPICRSIIEAHGGRVWASNRIGRGAVFLFSLPPLVDSEL